MMATRVETNALPDSGGQRADSGIDQLCINTMRTLAMDAVQKANSGHPGTPMSLSPVAYTLWQRFLNYDPDDANWPNRDRFVLSVGHASMLLYSLIHLTGIKAINEHEDRGGPALTIDDLKAFRQLDSKTPGHPEYRMTSGVETTTGPLGQGCGNSVGMAMAEKYLAARYNKPGFPIFDYHIYTLAGDGDMMEGVSGESASVAGHLGLGNLTWIYDSNKITIEGSTDLAFSEHVLDRFKGYNWHTLEVQDANDEAEFTRAIEDARAVTDRPSFIMVHSTIAWGAPTKAGTHGAHGSPLGDEEIRGTKRNYGWPEDAQFLVPPEVPKHFDAVFGKRGREAHAAWNEMLARYRNEYPELAAELEMINQHTLPEGWDKDIPVFETDAKGVASRVSSGKVLNAIAPHVPFMIGGSADLSPSTNTNMTFQGAGSFERDNYSGRNLHFGIREHAMGSILNGLAVTGLRAYGSGFLIFSDYMKAPIRLSAIMELPVLYIFTHDSFGVGEDGPTHQPIEQIAQLRATPGLITMRPGDANEVAEAWRVLLPLKEQPACLILSRQNLPTIDRSKYASAKGVAKGGYVLADPKDGKAPDVILIATGSEVALAVGAYETLTAEGIPARVVSLPSWDLFEAQPQSYRDEVLPPHIIGRVGIEQAASIGWDRYVLPGGALVAMHTFGASAPMGALQKKFGFTPEKVTELAREQAARKSH
jgi:transketolase